MSTLQTTLTTKDLVQTPVYKTRENEKEEAFVRLYGSAHCRVLIMKDYSTVISVLQALRESEPLTEKEIEFLKQNAGQHVLGYMIDVWKIQTDIFLFGDDNIPFPMECFEANQ